MKTAVIYARYSSDSQTEQSIEGQLRVCSDYAKRNNIIIVDTYIDRAMTGTNDNRAAFQKMLHDSSKHQWEIVLVYKLDRFSRNKYESVIHKKTLKDNGVKIVSAMENIPDSPEGTLMESVLEGFNQYFSEELTQKINRGLRESWIKGNATGGKSILGYKIVNKKYVIDEYEANIVREIFERYSNGQVVRTIIKELFAKGICKSNGKPYEENYVYRILHDKRYTGIVEHHEIVYENIFPRIISDSLWRSVSSINDENKLSPSRKKDIYDYLLSGKLVCGICHRKMYGVSGTSHSGKKYYYYACAEGKHTHNCDLKKISKFFLEDLIISRTQGMLSNEKNIIQIAEKVINLHKKETANNTTLKLLQKNRNDAYNASRNIIKAIEMGIITEQTRERLSELENQINQLDYDIEREKNRNYSYLSVDKIQKYLYDKFLKFTENTKARKLLIHTFVREIIVYPNKIIITFNFTDMVDSVKIDKSATEQIERQSKTAFSLDDGSHKLSHSLPKKHTEWCAFLVECRLEPYSRRMAA